MAATTRTPIMAGNWKMNLNHQEAVVLVQKLAWTLSDKRHDYAKAEVVVLPPFTDICSVQTLVDGYRLASDDRMKVCISSASEGEAVRPVPIAQTGS